MGKYQQFLCNLCNCQCMEVEGTILYMEDAAAVICSECWPHLTILGDRVAIARRAAAKERKLEAEGPPEQTSEGA